MLDYLVVGLGLAGISFCEILEKNGKTFKVVNDDSQKSSVVAAGVYNPVILKRFTMAWKAKDQMEMVEPYLNRLEEKLKVKLNDRLPILRRFASVEEQNLWFEACDKDGLYQFLSTEILQNKNPNVAAPFGYGQVLGTGKIDTKKVITSYDNYLTGSLQLIKETFDYDSLKISMDSIKYKGIDAKHLIFAEGYGLRHNPYFDYLPLTGTKGELLTIKAPELKEDHIIKSSVFIVPVGDDLYKVGATYNWNHRTSDPTETAKSELLQKLEVFLKCDYEVVDHVAGIRPTVTDRRPLVGRHLKHRNLYVLNGFGSRGVLIGPYASKELFDFIENGNPIDPEIDINRFIGKYQNG